MKILVTGGHLTPALAVIDAMKKKMPDVKIQYVGKKYASDTGKEPTLEYSEIKKRDIYFHHLKAGRFTRLFTLSALLHFLYIPIGFYNAFRIVLKSRPDVILSFGSYIGVAVTIAGFLLRKRVYVHEQTMHPGLANTISSRFAKAVFVSFPDSKKYFPKGKKVIFTGNPIRDNVFRIVKKPVSFSNNLPVIYVTGGSMGSHSINVHIESILGELLQKYNVIHQIGNLKEYGDFDRLTKLKETLESDVKDRYIPSTHFASDEIGSVYALADLVIGRSGANTFFELVQLKKPAILIPLPWASHDEQRLHALLFAKKGAGEVFEQKGKSADLLVLIEKVITNKSEYIAHFTNFENVYFQDAAQNIVSALFP